MQRTTITAYLIWALLLLASLIYLSSSLRVVSDVTQFMPAEHNDKNVQLLLNELQQGNTARLLILQIQGTSSTKLAELSRQLKNNLNKSPAFDFIHNGQQSISPKDFIAGDYKQLYHYRYLLYPNNLFSDKALSSALKQRFSELRSGINIFKETLSSDPQNHFTKYLWNLSDRGETARHHGVWFNKEKTATLLVVELNVDSFDLDQQQYAIEEIHKNITNWSDKQSIKLKVDITGAASMAVKTRDAIQSTTKWLSSIALVLMFLLFWWAYRSFRLFLIASLPLASAIIAALTATNLIFNQVHGIIIAFGITLLGVCLDYPVHLFSHHSQSQSPQQTILSIWPTLRLGVITTALAYLAMLGTGFSGLSQLSVFAVSGLFTALFTTRWIIPFLIQFNFIKPETAYLSSLSKLNVSLKRKSSIAGAIIIFCILIISNNYDSIWSKNISDLSPIPEEVKNLDKKLRHAVAAPDVNHVFLLKDKSSEILLQRTETLKNTLLELKNKKIVSHIFSVADFIPSKKTQRIYQQQLPTKSNLKNSIDNAKNGLPFKPSFFKPFINDVEKSKVIAPLDVEQFLATPLGRHLQQDLFFTNNKWISIVRLSGVKNEAILLNWLSTKPDVQAHYLNLRQATSSLMTDYQQTALFRLMLGSLVIGLILLSVRSLSRAGIIMLPVVLAVLLSISIQVMLGTQLTLFHILALLLIVGIGLDYSLFFDRRCASSKDYQQRLHGIFISAASTLITFGILGFSDIPVLSALGQTVTFGVLSCFVLTLVFNINNSEKI